MNLKIIQQKIEKYLKTNKIQPIISLYYNEVWSLIEKYTDNGKNQFFWLGNVDSLVTFKADLMSITNNKISAPLAEFLTITLVDKEACYNQQKIMNSLLIMDAMYFQISKALVAKKTTTSMSKALVILKEIDQLFNRPKKTLYDYSKNSDNGQGYNASQLLRKFLNKEAVGVCLPISTYSKCFLEMFGVSTKVVTLSVDNGEEWGYHAKLAVEIMPHKYVYLDPSAKISFAGMFYEKEGVFKELHQYNEYQREIIGFEQTVAQSLYRFYLDENLIDIKDLSCAKYFKDLAPHCTKRSPLNIIYNIFEINRNAIIRNIKANTEDLDLYRETLDYGKTIWEAYKDNPEVLFNLKLEFVIYYLSLIQYYSNALTQQGKTMDNQYLEVIKEIYPVVMEYDVYIEALKDCGFLDWYKKTNK